ncbi:hypothetical protein SUGI_1497330 [Cryptomeria japonica]|uniref:HMA domain-containing protein n=1 Tax=Cryptomeria japonica TaxID=3369 RepID=A0AAD3NUJ6_CRYJA|nr:cadmium/zinc-transporting ATPase HMA3-like [Cryptomeria japonica]GLJ14792.1 hypothetical protein SUGI_0240030 [Cryptomeria japonica]GLJ14894.1 hypothetical protein SUGI_0242330 [Cryptomeria japonica]GLJ59203.1 hypothetical protein SUGI_1497330 [Cryptomeria japonica]
MRKTKLRLQGTYKESQKQEIEKLLQALDGVGEVEVDLQGKFVIVHHNPRSQDGSALVKALGKRFKASIEGFTDY